MMVLRGNLASSMHFMLFRRQKDLHSVVFLSYLLNRISFVRKTIEPLDETMS